jgi:hypothetical protein
MPAYGNLDTAIAGELYGLHPRTVESWRAAEQINFGVPVFTYEGEDFSDGNGSIYNVKQDTTIITLDADLVASNVITTTLTIDGVAQTPVATTFITNHDTTMTTHKNALEAAITNLAVTLTDGTNNREFTILLKGSNFTSTTSVVTLGASQAVATITYTTAQVFVGMSVITHKSLSGSVGYYEAEEAVNVLTDGWIYSATTAVAVSANTDAYVIWTGGSADQGKLTPASSGNYVTNMKFRNTLATAGLAVVEVRGQYTDATP